MGSWVCTGDSKSLLVHICSDLGRRDKGRGPGGFAAALLEGEEDGEGRGGRAREGRAWHGCARGFWSRDEPASGLVPIDGFL